ncbi:hypothetical protein X975_25380, partial [Stegodyphus mimosarum]
MRLKKLRRHPFLLACFVFCSILCFVYLRHQRMDASEFWVYENIQSFLINTSGYQIPAWNPWDKSVKHLYEPVDQYKCLGSPSFLRVLPNGTVTLEDALLQYYYEIQFRNISCVFREIIRNTSNSENIDNDVTFGRTQALIFDQPLGAEFIYTKCDAGSPVGIFQEFLPLTPLKSTVEELCNHRQKQINVHKPMNVIFLGIDSVSQLNFIRHFPKCQDFLSKVLFPINLKGYNKVGDNTFPNIMPLLTGHFHQYYDKHRSKNLFFDDVDFIWKIFSKMGYRTMLAEDAPNIATFNYQAKGFRKPPTDYYYRPFALAVEKSELKSKSRGQCFGTKMEMQIIYDYLRSFVETMGDDRPFFVFSFLARLTHDVLNFAGYADEPTYQLLKFLHDNRILENTLLIFFSDHGIRFGPIRKTRIGQYEERLPFMYLVFPKSFLNTYESIHKNLVINSERLTTPFDIHSTILNLAAVLRGDATFENNMQPGTSLFYEVPSNRTCSQAGITPHWCTCQVHHAITKEDPVARKSAEAVIQAINNLTAAYRRNCSILTLDELLDAKISDYQNLPHTNIVQNNTVSEYLVIVSAAPSEAVFEATVRCETVEETDCRVVDDISRINEYGEQSSCVPNAILRKFCYCI